MDPSQPQAEEADVDLIQVGDPSDVDVGASVAATGKATVSTSKAMSLLLRHSGPKEGLEFRDAWVACADLLRHRRMKGTTLATLVALVRDSDKQRFAFGKDAAGKLYIRANQGHSFAVNIRHRSITSREDLPNGIAVHGTYYDAWKLISQSGLSRMSRQHIHLATGLPRDEGVISGMRSSAQVLVYVDVDKCIASGIPLLLSLNGVVLSPGNAEGLIPVSCFESVVDARTKKKLL